MVRGSAPLLCRPTAAGSRWAPLPASPWGKGVFLLHLTLLLARFVLHLGVPFTGIRACMASFQVPPSPLCFRKSSTFCWYVLPTRVLSTEALPPLITTLPHRAPGHGGCSSASLVRGGDGHLTAQVAGHLEDAAGGHLEGCAKG